MTVPKPFMLNTRSTGMRKYPASSSTDSPASRSSMISFSRSIPWPDTDETRTTGASSRNEPVTSDFTSSSTSISHSSSTRSHFVRTTMPASTPMYFTVPRCSTVWGMTPSSAATTKRTR